jgi:tetratricopeptide (TPR) repeat protein
MIDQKETILQNAVNKLRDGDYYSFNKAIKTLFQKHLTCNCFLWNKGEKYWNDLVSVVENLTSLYLFDDGATLFCKGFIYKFAEMEVQAFEILTEAIRLDPVNDVLYSLRSSLDEKINIGRTNDALEAIALYPSTHNYYRLGMHYREAKQYAKSIYFLTKAIELKSSFSCALANRGNVYFEVNQLSLSERDCKKAIELDNENINAHYILSQTLNSQNKYFESLQISNIGLNKFSKCPQFYFPIGDSEWGLENFEKSISAYKKGLISFPDVKYATQRIEQYNTIVSKRQDRIGVSPKQNSTKRVTGSHPFTDSFSLANYIPQSNDILSMFLLQFKNNEKFIVDEWIRFAKDQLNEVHDIKNLNIGYVARVLGSQEKGASLSRMVPLDNLSIAIANDVGALYIPDFLRKWRTTRKFSREVPLYKDRLNEVSKVYTLEHSFVLDKPLLLIDDILTSGATTTTIGNLIKERFPQIDIYLFTLGKTLRLSGSNDELYNSIKSKYFNLPDFVADIFKNFPRKS